MAWQDVLDKAADHKIVEVLTDKDQEEVSKDIEITRRAVGIVFRSLPEEEWESEKVVQMIGSVVGQLRQKPQEAK